MASTNADKMRRVVFTSTGLITAALLTANIVLSSIDASVTIIPLSTFQGTATTAAVFNAFALVAVIALIFSRLFNIRRHWLFSWMLPWTGALIALAAAILSLNILILKRINPKDVFESNSKSTFHISTATGITVWVLANAAQLGFYALVAFLRFPEPALGQEASLNSIGEKRRQGPSRPPSPPSRQRIIAPPYVFPPEEITSPSFPPESRRHSWRDSLASLHQVVLPSTTSRSRLLGSSRASRSSMPRDSTSLQSDTGSIANSIRSDYFDSWDTSIAETQTRDTLMAPSPSPIPSKGTTLETIPGSRSGSPARVLDGPFPERPQTALSASSKLDRPSTAITVQPRRNFSGSRPPSRTASPSMAEAHIHPLFRTDSPTPPPGASPGTVVVASSFSGQVIGQVTSSPRSSLSQMRMRSSSDTYMPRAPSRTGANRVRESIDKQSESPGAASGTSTPATGSLTPSIPEFVLSASRERII
jgi:hypothetical protein